ncbi:MAG: hypothetical protein GF421_11585 [Candidatus Aminicenantes bacterium]|nr:hypothetical protein [Candidatus Aminicenantes bacterium]
MFQNKKLIFKHFFIKEWKEKSLIFFLAALFLAALTGIRFSGQDELTMYLSGMFVWFFLPFSAAMIGSSGFYHEYKNNAWIYLLSRPVKKPVVWLFKYIPQLTMVLVIYGIFLFLVLVLPGFKEILEVFSFSGRLFHYSALSSSLLIAITAFSLAFSLSILHDKPFIIFLTAIFIGAGISFLVNFYSDFLYRNHYGMNNLIGISYLWPAAFILGSLYTFSRVDFSQSKAKLTRFILVTALSLIAAGAISTGLTLVDWHFRGRDYMFNLTVLRNDAFFRTKKGTLRYDKLKDKTTRITRRRGRLDASRSGDKALLLTYDYHQEGESRKYTYTLKLINPDGSEIRKLVQTQPSGTPFTGLRIRNFDISPCGQEVVFITENPRNSRIKIWTLRSDGSEQREFLPEIPDLDQISIAGWTSDYRIILLAVKRSSGQGTEMILLSFDPDHRTLKRLASFIRKPHLCSVSSSGKFAAYVYFDPASEEEVLEITNLFSGDSKEIHRGGSIHDIQWGQENDTLVFTLETNQIGIFSLETGKISAFEFIPAAVLDSLFPSLDWICGDQKLALRGQNNEPEQILIMDRNLEVQEIIDAPSSFRAVYSMDRTILIYNQTDNQLWCYDMDKDKWKNIY